MKKLDAQASEAGSPSEEGSRMGRVQLAFSALVGGVICVLADLVQKSTASAVTTLGRSLEVTFDIPFSSVVATALILSLGIALCFIFDARRKRIAFYYGTSILALIMVGVPYKVPPGLSLSGNSVEVKLNIASEIHKPINNSVVTLMYNNE